MSDLEKRLSEIPEQPQQHLQRMRQHQEPHSQMRLHHLGFACYDIEEGISHIKRLYDVKQCSEPVFDPQQNAQVCMLDTANGLSLELIAGHAVESLLKQGICLYQVCYEVPDIFQSIDDFLAEGATLISEPKPATLFENRLVAFLNTKLGLIELLEASVSPLSAERANAGATPHRSQRAETVAITATFSAEPLETSLDFWMQELQYQAEVRFAPYNQVFQQLLDPSSLLGSHKQGVNVVLLRLEDWLNDESFGLDRTRQQAQLEKNIKDFVSAIRAAVERSVVPYLVCCCPASPETLAEPHLANLLECQEASLLDELADVGNVHRFSSTELLTGYPVADYYDPHTDRLGHVPFTPAFFAALGTTLARRISALKRAPYKVIVLDCDNTLWKGVCGEDGALGVTIAPSYRTLQEYMLKQHEAGMLLCLCSKNQEDDVFEVLDRHPEMLLTREHLTASRINWHAKSENLRSLADELNLGLDSFIFVDDNPLECAEVGANCPEVLTLQLPAEPERIPQVLQHFWAFDRVNVTDEDRTRSAHYQQNLQREQSRRDALTFQEFLDQLDLKISISPVDASQLPRAAQLTHRTNQFNLTTIRRSENDIQALCEQEGYECLVTEVRDRFGDYGLVGVMLFKTGSDAIRVDTFLLSCRALGRGVEHRMLAELGTLAQAREVDHVAIEYIRSPKNQPALDFLESQGAVCKEELEDRTIFRFPSTCAAGIAFQPPEGNEDDSQRREDRTQPAERRATGEEQELLRRIAAELYDVDRILSAISARKHRARPELESQFVAPRTPVEEGLAAIWADILELDRVGVDDDFFQVGGHSLLATQILSRIIERFQVHVPLRTFLQEPTIAGISAQIATQLDEDKNVQKRRKEATPDAFTIRAVPRDSPLPLSFAQERVWFFQQLEPESAAYNLAANARLTGPLNLEALTFGIEEIVRRHESLRTRFVVSENGMPVQVVEAEVLVKLPLEDLSVLPDDEREAEVRRLIAEEIQTPFDLTQCPLFRFSLVRIQEDEHLLLATKHHIISDEWSSKVFLKELCHLYDAFSAQIPAPLPHLEIHSADFAYWQHQRGQSELFEKQLEYWKKRLEGLPPMLDLPTDRPRPSIQHYRGASTSFMLSSELSESLKTLSRQEQGTLFMTFLAAFNVLLYRYSGSEDIAVGFPVANRNLRQLEPLIGFFVNTLVLRTNLTGELGFRELLRQTIASSAEAQDNQDLPFERIVAELHPKRELSHNPLFQVMFVWYTTLSDAAELADGLCLTPVDTEDAAAIFDLTLTLEERAEGVRGKFIYNSDLFDEATIDRMIEHFRVLLEGIAGNPDREIALLPLLPKSEEQLLLREWNRTEAAYPDQACIHKLFEVQAERNPDAVAVRFGEQQLSYRQLNLRANQVAHYLREQVGLAQETLVGICVERSLEMIVGMLGVLKAGCAYLPLDPAYPKERLAFMFSDSRIPVLLTQQHLSDRLPKHAARVICLDTDWKDINLKRSENPVAGLTSEALAYVIYTSGSTGKPKGTLISHQGACNVSQAQINMFQAGPGDRVLQFASLSFDAATFEMMMALCSGATLCLGTKEELLPGPALLNFLRDNNISIVTLSPSALANVPYEKLPALRVMTVAGEACPGSLVSCWADGRSFFNLYGPTESTIWATAARCFPNGKNPPIGRPIANIKIYILDASLKPVPVGVPGEIHISGVGLARGYLNRPELTAEKFIANPFNEHPGERLYKTGDLARYSADGNIEFLGRIDHQVKLRGFRIELGEVESCLLRHPEVGECAVVLREDSPGDQRLSAYLVLAEGGRSGAEVFRNFLKQSLPEYMVPSFVIILERFPLTPNGKVDRRALPAPDLSLRHLHEEFIAPRTEMEKRLATLWRGALKLEQIGIHDDFFELGGHSLLAAQLSASISNEFKREVPVQQLFLHPTIAQLTEILEEHTEPAPEERVSLESDLPQRRADENPQAFRSSFLQCEHRSLLPLFLTGKIPPVDAAALSYLDALILYLPTFEREYIIKNWRQDFPVLSHVFETEWGRIAHFFLPRFAADLYTDREDAVAVSLDALKIAGTIGAKVVSLTGIIPSATDYGKAIVKDLDAHSDLPQITTGHGTTCATVVLTIKQILEAGGRKMSQERVGFLGLGSVGISVLHLMLESLPHPGQLLLCDVYAKQEVLESIRQELRHELGFKGKIRVITSQKEVPEEFYNASLIVGATNVPNVLDVEQLEPGTMIVDDSGPHCFHSDRAIARFEKQQDILFSEGGVLQIPHPLQELHHIPPYLERAFTLEQLERHWQKEDTQITGCVLSSILSARFKELPLTVGMIKTSDALRHYEKLLELGCRAADLRCEGYQLPEELVVQFRQRFHS